ncbi:hypothetical protein DPSP01_005967 [Paraphaeosphaeria sporulosa]|uniref:Xaa-Pro aminopeptidase n=1 Tax=Paraphaeosphaeria sporulosa TaxID=1460663 RepID=A0A177CBT0_9PLEO|nr:uncharacterized protein CC84DRAFT_1123953 [Paraphaeosphaeria sporulosa]OAG04160.1 hypothetical protein CC84DRAFT_1123953 [Paraphaeosphaeria sporulosa]
MDDLATNLDGLKLAERLHGVRQGEYWLHLEAEGPLEKYPAKQHARRVRERLDVAEGLIYLPGAPARSNEDSDMPAPFRQRRYFYYMSGCNETSCQLAYDIRRDILTLFIPRINPDRVVWNGRGSTPAEAMDKYDVDEVFHTDQVESWIHDWFLHYRHDQQLYVLHKEQMPPLRFPWPVDCTSLLPAMYQCRMIKDDHEIKLIRKANEISSKAHKQVLANITKFHNEAQVEGQFLNTCVSHQAKQQAYDIIAASGPNAGTLHYDANNEDFEDRQLMCLDAGCEYELYASDITRTFPLSKSWPSKEAENIYKLVERMQEACIQKLAPGVRYLDLHVFAHQIAIDGLLKLGLLHNGTREEIFKAGTSKAFFPHGLGHHVGLEVHDVGQQELMSLYKHPKYDKVPSLYPEDFHLPVYDTKQCMAPTDPQSPHLEEGNVVTVEPGIYFSAYVFSHFYLPSPVHSKYINTEVLYKYFPVGGVRIEDDILITSKGYENLTTAPKGDDMFTIIRGQPTGSTIKSRDTRMDTLQEPLRLAPGISKRVADPLLETISPAATDPRATIRRASVEEDPTFQDHWLFNDSRKTAQSTRDERKEKSAQTARHAVCQNNHVPLCGTASAGVEHMYMGWQNQVRNNTASPYLGIGIKAPVQKCQQCVVLSEAVDRLRETLSRSTKTSPTTSPRLGSGEFECRGSNKPVPPTGNRFVPPMGPKVSEMRQINPLPPRNFADRTLRELSAPGYEIPSSSTIQCHEIIDNTTTTAPRAKTQRRSVTFDSLPAVRPQSLTARSEYLPRPSDWYTESPRPMNMRANLPVHNYSEPPRTTSSVIPEPNPTSQWNFTNLQRHVPKPQPPLPEAWASVVQRKRVSADDLARGSLSAAVERGKDREPCTHPADFLRRPDPRPSLPNLRQGALPAITRREGAASVRSNISNSQNRQTAYMADLSAYDHGLRHRRSMGSALRSSANGCMLPETQPPLDSASRNAAATVSRTQGISHWNEQRQRLERLERETRPLYGRSRPGGEELQGVDYTR